MHINVPPDFSDTIYESGWELWLASMQNSTELMKIRKGNHEVRHENYIPYHSQKLLVESSETNYGGSRRTTISTKYKDNVKRVKLSWKLLQN